MKKLTLAVLSLLLAASAAAAEVSVPAIFGSDMLLQRSTKTLVWGKAAPNEPVSVELQMIDSAPSGATGTIARSTNAAADGSWSVPLDLTHAFAAPATLVIKGPTNTLTLTNVLVGDVWLCGGQSNMEWPTDRALDSQSEIAAAKYPMLRLFTVTKRISAAPTAELEGKWLVCSPETVGSFSAVGYFFGRDLWQTRKQPLGLISVNWGGTPAESWTSVESLKAAGPELAPTVTGREAAIETDKAHPATQPNDRRAFNQNTAASLYDGMLRPLMPLTVTGAIWYQGESNAGRAAQYEPLMKTMIADWRKGFTCDRADFPFLMVQLANFQAIPETPGDSDWAELREVQTRLADTVPNVGMAVIFDIGEASDIHPRNKQDVGHRLALQARKIAYRESNLLAAGPKYKAATFEGNIAKITFDNTGTGLMAQNGGDTVEGFAICGPDHKWSWADARIEGNTVIVSSPSVPAPVAVRYAWANNCPATLSNKEALPACPFRTDNFPRITEGKH